MGHSDSKSRLFTISIVLKLIAFSMLAFAGYLDLSQSENTILQDPFSLGAFVMAFPFNVNEKQYKLHSFCYVFLYFHENRFADYTF